MSRRGWAGADAKANLAARKELAMLRFYRRHSDDDAGVTLWNTGYAMVYGAAIGAAAAAVKLVAPWSEPRPLLAMAEEVVGAALAFALLCGVAAAIRNFIVRRLDSQDI